MRGIVRYEDERLIDWKIEDVISDRRLLYATQPYSGWEEKTRYFRIFWNEQMTDAILYSWDCEGEFSCRTGETVQFHHLNWNAGTVEPISGQAKPFTDEDLYNLSPYNQLWSPNGKYAAFLDIDNHIVIFDLSTSQPHRIVEIPSVQRWQWASETDALILRATDELSIYQYNLSAQRLERLTLPIENDRFDFWISPDAHSIILKYVGLPSEIVSLVNGSRLTWPMHSLGINGGIWTEYLWHPGSQWVISSERISFAGSGGGPEAMTILNVDGTLRRELGVCFNYRTCAGFVPDRALPHLGEGNSESVIQQPEYTLPHDGRVTGVAWSPDGSKLASYNFNSQYGSGGELHLWNVSGTPELIITYQTNLYCNPYPVPCGLIWSDDGQRITLNDYENVETWDIVRGIPVDDHKRRDGFPPVSSDGETQFIETFVDEKNVFIVENPEKTMTLMFEKQVVNLYSADMRPNGRYIVAASLYYPIHVWDAQTGEQLPYLNWYAMGVALSPDGTRLAAAGTSLVTIWSTSDFAH